MNLKNCYENHGFPAFIVCLIGIHNWTFITTEDIENNQKTCYWCGKKKPILDY